MWSPQPEPEEPEPEAKPCRAVPHCRGLPDFGGRRVHFVQIGLGNNTTFVQNLAGRKEDWHHGIDWLLDSCDERRPQFVRGVAVEPVPEYAEAMQTLAARLQNVAVVQAAIGEGNGRSTTIHVLDSPEELCSQVSKRHRQDLLWQLSYLRNMSCVGRDHPEFATMSRKILQRCGVHVKTRTREVELWSWARLAQNLCFAGCQVLLVDAEGHDASILRSMLQHCRGRPRELPDLIQFETRGHCDSVEGGDAEWGIIDLLQDAGYDLLAFSHADTHLAHNSALRRRGRLWRWAQLWACRECQRRGRFPYYSPTSGQTYCLGCWKGWKQGWRRNSEQAADGGRWSPPGSAHSEGVRSGCWQE